MENNNYQTTEQKQQAASIYVGGHIFDLFRKSGIAPNCTPDQWKEFEKNLFKYIYTVLGEDNPPIEVCNFTAFINAFSEALVVASILEQKMTELQAKLPKTDQTSNG